MHANITHTGYWLGMSDSSELVDVLRLGRVGLDGASHLVPKNF